MVKDNIINSIYDNYDYYQGRVGNIVGKDSLFIDDLISDCTIKIHLKLKDGSIKPENISKDGKILTYYFSTVICNYAYDYLRKSNPKFVEIESLAIEEEEQPFDIDVRNTYDNVLETLEKMSSKGIKFKHCVDVFKYYYIDKLNISELSRQTTISRTSLIKSRKIVEEWLKEEKRKVLV